MRFRWVLIVSLLLDIRSPGQTPYRPYSIVGPTPLPELVERRKRLQDWLQAGWSVTPAKAFELEAELAHNAENLPVRFRLVSYYGQQLLSEAKARHILWLIENHPEAEIFQFAGTVAGLSPAEYPRAEALWRRQAARFPTHSKVIANAVMNVHPEVGIKMIEAAHIADPQNVEWTRWLAKNYGDAIRWTFWDGKSSMAFTGDAEDFRHFPLILALSACPQVKENAERSVDGPLVEAIGESLVRQVRLLKERGLITPEVQEVSEYGERMRDRGRMLVRQTKPGR